MRSGPAQAASTCTQAALLAMFKLSMAPAAVVPAVSTKQDSLRSIGKRSVLILLSLLQGTASNSNPRILADFFIDICASSEATIFFTPFKSLATHKAVRLESVDPGVRCPPFMPK